MSESKEQISQAIQQYREALKKDPNDAKTHHLLATMLYKNNIELPEAKKHFQQAVKLKPDFIEAHYGLATLLSTRLKEYEPARLHFEKVLDLNPNAAAAQFGFAQLLAEQFKEYELARIHFQKAINLNPNLFQAHYQIARLYYDFLDDTEKAKEHFLQVIKINPKYSRALSDLGYLHEKKLKNYEEAQKYYQNALKADPNESVAAYNLAQLYHLQLQDLQKARAMYLRTIEIDPKFSDAFLGLALTQHSLKDVDLARKNYLKACELNADLRTPQNDQLFTAKSAPVKPAATPAKDAPVKATAPAATPEPAEKIPDGLTNLKEVFSFIGHMDRLTGVTFSPDGKLVASSSIDKTIHLWDVSRGRKSRILNENSDIFAIGFSKGGQKLYCAIGNAANPENPSGAITVWSLTKGDTIAVYERGLDIPHCLAMSSDGNALVAGYRSGAVKLWDLNSDRKLHTLNGHTGPVQCVAYSSGNRLVASGSADKTVRIWDTLHGKQVLELSGHLDAVDCLAFSPDGQLIASGSFDRTIRCWEVLTGKNVLTITNLGKPVRGLTFSREGHLLIGALGFSGRSGDEVPAVKIFETATGNPMAELSEFMGDVISLCLSPDGKQIAGACSDKAVRLWSFNYEPLDEKTLTQTTRTRADNLNNDFQKTFQDYIITDEGCKKEVSGLLNQARALMLKDKYEDFVNSILLTQAAWLSMRYFMTDLRSLKEFHEFQEAPVAHTFLPDSERIACWSQNKDKRGELTLYDLRTRQQSQKFLLKNVSKESFHPGGFSFSAGSKFLAYVYDKATVKLLNVEDGKETATIKLKCDSIQDLVLSPDGRWLAASHITTGRDKEQVMVVQLIEIASGQAADLFYGRSQPITCLAFSKDGEYVVGGSTDETVSLWDVASKTNRWKIKVHEGTKGVIKLLFMPGGKMLASMANKPERGDILLLDPGGPRVVRTLLEHQEPLLDLVFSADGKLMGYAYGNAEGRGICIRAIDTEQEFFSGIHGGGSIAFSPDGRRVAIRTGTNTLRVMSFESSILVKKGEAHQQPRPDAMAEPLAPKAKPIAAAPPVIEAHQPKPQPIPEPPKVEEKPKPVVVPDAPKPQPKPKEPAPKPEKIEAPKPKEAPEPVPYREPEPEEKTRWLPIIAMLLITILLLVAVIFFYGDKFKSSEEVQQPIQPAPQQPVEAPKREPTFETVSGVIDAFEKVDADIYQLHIKESATSTIRIWATIGQNTGSFKFDEKCKGSKIRAFGSWTGDEKGPKLFATQIDLISQKEYEDAVREKAKVAQAPRAPELPLPQSDVTAQTPSTAERLKPATMPSVPADTSLAPIPTPPTGTSGSTETATSAPGVEYNPYKPPEATEPIKDISNEPQFVAYDEPPMPVKKVSPAYPEIARKAGFEGRVIINILVDVDGKVKNAVVLKDVPNSGFGEAAVAAAKQWEFLPAIYQGKPIKVWTSQTFKFDKAKK